MALTRADLDIIDERVRRIITNRCPECGLRNPPRNETKRNLYKGCSHFQARDIYKVSAVIG